MFCVIYDGNCNLCVNLVRLLETLDQGHKFRYVPMQDSATLASFDITPEDCEAGMIVIDLHRPENRWQGSSAAEKIGRQLPLGHLFVQAYQAIPGVKPTGDQVYEYVRDNRYALFGKRPKPYNSAYPWCDGGRCKSFSWTSRPTTASPSEK
jgi:predicted DCC family thiol-disulfide oxidoreductase YuxK